MKNEIEGVGPLLGFAVLLVFLGALLLFLSCSPPAPTFAPEAQRIPAGDYTLRAFVHRTEGSCAWIQSSLMTAVNVDDAGQISSPFPGASCTTSYGDWIALACSGFGAKLSAGGVLEPSGAQGSGEIRGNIGGCTLVGFTFQLVRR